MNKITLTYTTAALPGITQEVIEQEIKLAIERMNESSVVRFEIETK